MDNNSPINTSQTHPAPDASSRHAWTEADVRALGPATDLMTAAAILNLSRNSAYRLARADRFPVPVIKAGGQYRVLVSGLLALLYPQNYHTAGQ